ncbi:MAG: hypothetical protein OHK0031_03550 [Anaerolineales bacterium]
MPELDLAKQAFAFLEIQTTGLSPWFGDRICEIDLLRTEGRRIKKTWRTLLNPQMRLSPAAALSLRAEELSTAPLFGDCADELESLLEGAILVCHNAQFKLQFLDDEFHRLGCEFHHSNLIDLLFVARQHFDFPSYGLTNMAIQFKIPHPQADALTAKNLFFAMLQALRPLDKSLDDFVGVYNSPAWPQDGFSLPTELGEAIYGGKRLTLVYIDKDGEQTQRSVTPLQVLGLADYLYLRAFCHLRQGERTFRLDRILQLQVES